MNKNEFAYQAQVFRSRKETAFRQANNIFILLPNLKTSGKLTLKREPLAAMKPVTTRAFKKL